MGEAADFIHLRVHTAYSLLEGAIKIKMEEKESKFAFVKDNLVGMCEQFRMPAVAMTDTNNLFGAFEMSQACASHGIKPIIGEQAYVDLGVDEHRMGSVKDVCRPDSLCCWCRTASATTIRANSRKSPIWTRRRPPNRTSISTR